MDEYGRFVHGEFVKGIPQSYTTKDGRTISNYHMQDSSRWKYDGFKSVELVYPTLGHNQEYSNEVIVTELEFKIVVEYVTINRKEEPIDNTVHDLQRRIDTLKERIRELENDRK